MSGLTVDMLTLSAGDIDSQFNA